MSFLRVFEFLRVLSFVFCFVSFFFGVSITKPVIKPDDVFHQCHLQEVPAHQ